MMLPYLTFKMKIQLENCDIKIGKKTILNEVNFQLKKGSFYKLNGKNGSGKTVFIQSLLGFNKAKGQRVSIFNPDKLCYIPDIAFFNDYESVNDVIQAISFFYNVKRKVVLDILDYLKFDPHVRYTQKISELSKGTKKKLEIIPLFIPNLEIFFLDEIMSGLDTDTVILVCTRLKKLQEDNATVILIEHNQHILDYLNYLIKDLKEITCVNQKIILN